MMGGDLVWDALDVVCEILGVTDVEALIERLNAMKKYYRDTPGAR